MDGILRTIHFAEFAQHAVFPERRLNSSDLGKVLSAPFAHPLADFAAVAVHRSPFLTGHLNSTCSRNLQPWRVGESVRLS